MNTIENWNGGLKDQNLLSHDTEQNPMIREKLKVLEDRREIAHKNI